MTSKSVSRVGAEQGVSPGDRSHLHVSVIIPTCSRPQDLERCLYSLTHVVYPNWDILLVDQSDDNVTKALAEKFSHLLPNFTYRRMKIKGLSRARNAGMDATKGDIISFLDDDCTVDPDWLNQVVNAFMRNPRADLLFGALRAVPHDPTAYFIPAFEVPFERILHGSHALFLHPGFGASMSLRRVARQRVGLFDTELGAGAHFSLGGDDTDYGYRTLMAGGSIVQTPLVVVHHHGARDYASGAASRLAKGYAKASGALDMKFVRCGRAFGVLMIGAHVYQATSTINLRHVIRRRGPSGVGKLLMYIAGLASSFTCKVDRQTCLYKATHNR